MKPLLKMRLQGGPFDGATRREGPATKTPEQWFISKCVFCGCHWHRARLHGNSEVYRLYVFTDERLAGWKRLEEQELVGASTGPRGGA